MAPRHPARHERSRITAPVLTAPVVTVATSPFEGQRPGTSGLRKTVRTFQQPGYVEAYLQSVFDAVDAKAGATLVIGGDGRFLNAEVVQVALRMAAANGVRRAVVGREGLLSTPAASHLIRLRGAVGGLILSPATTRAGRRATSGSSTTWPTAAPRRKR